jgi:hypothetical protein
MFGDLFLFADEIALARELVDNTLRIIKDCFCSYELRS